MAGRLKGGLLRWMTCQNPHNQQVAAVFDFIIRLASHPFMHPRLPSELSQFVIWRSASLGGLIGFLKILVFESGSYESDSFCCWGMVGFGQMIIFADS